MHSAVPEHFQSMAAIFTKALVHTITKLHIGEVNLSEILFQIVNEVRVDNVDTL